MGELINGRTPEHIKAGLRCRVTGDAKCSDCAYYGTVLYEIGQREYECDDIDRDALALIEHLESERDAALAKVPKWISVKERLPQYSARYLVCYYRGQFASSVMQVSHFDTNKKEWSGASACSILCGVTHWMEKIEPPKEGAHG